MRRGKNASGERADDEQRLEHALHEVQVGHAARVVLPPVPERERRLAADLPADRAVPEDAQRVQRVRLEQDDRERRERREAAKPRRSRARRPRGRDTSSHSGATISEANFVQPARARRTTPRPTGDETSQKPQMRKPACSASFVFELDAYCVNGYAAHANASVAASCRPPKRRPTSQSPSMQSRSNAIDVKCAAGSVVPLAAPAEERGSPGCSDSYATGPYVSPCGFADSQRPFVWMRSRISPAASAGPHAFRSPSTGKLPYGACPCDDALGADHARVADVDHVRRAARSGRCGSRRGTRSAASRTHDGPDRARARAASREADPDAAQRPAR